MSFRRSPGVVRGQRGQMLPVVAFGLTALVGMGSLAVDVGTWRYEQRLEQSAADSAAKAGAIELYYGASDAQSVAQTDAATNGFPNNGTTIVVSAHANPGSGPYAGNNNAFEVVIDKDPPTFLRSSSDSRSSG